MRRRTSSSLSWPRFHVNCPVAGHQTRAIITTPPADDPPGRAFARSRYGRRRRDIPHVPGCSRQRHRGCPARLAAYRWNPVRAVPSEEPYTSRTGLPVVSPVTVRALLAAAPVVLIRGFRPTLPARRMGCDVAPRSSRRAQATIQRTPSPGRGRRGRLTLCQGDDKPRRTPMPISGLKSRGVLWTA